MREILFYETKPGYSPVIDFIESLPSKEAQKTAWVLQLVQELPTVPQKYFKKLTSTDDLWEVRVSSGGNAYRIIGFFERDNLIILNHAFQKKSQKTPQQVIKTSEKRKKEYLKRGNVK